MKQEQAVEIQKVMERELRRSMKNLKAPNHPRPYFISYLLHGIQGQDVWGRYGSVFNSHAFKSSDLYVEVRVGSHKLDQTIDGGLYSDYGHRESYNWLIGPQDFDPKALRYTLWKVTHHKYNEALGEFYDKKKILLEQHLMQDANSFSKEKRHVANHVIKEPRFNLKKWEAFVRDSSNLFRRHKNLVDPYVRIRGAVRTRVFVNSEGSKFICQEAFYEVAIEAGLLTKDGVRLPSARYFYGRQSGELPSLEQVAEAIDEIAKDLAGLAKAKPLNPYAGPALLSGVATGLVFHEAIGHRLEGERLVSRSEGHTFRDKIGRSILPAGVHLIDDPTLKKWNGTSLYGHYHVDDEGVPAKPVTLVENGVLQTFLMSRSPIPELETSNGHGRHERYQDPMARMANLLVKADEKRSWEDLKAMLCAEVIRRELPFGIVVKRVSSGETRTDHYDFQAFKGVPTEVYTIDPHSGKETRVRDVTFIGTPLAAIQKIRAFGEDYEVDNSYCFAESGSVPVATVAPAMLVDELELQRASSRRYRPPFISPPPMS